MIKGCQICKPFNKDAGHVLSNLFTTLLFLSQTRLITLVFFFQHQ